MNVVNSPSYRTRDIARAVNQSPRIVQLFLREKFPNHEGWHTFSECEFQSLLADIKLWILERRANRRRACFLAKNRI